MRVFDVVWQTIPLIYHSVVEEIFSQLSFGRGKSISYIDYWKSYTLLVFT